jgi:hypothetical protein
VKFSASVCNKPSVTFFARLTMSQRHCAKWSKPAESWTGVALKCNGTVGMTALRRTPMTDKRPLPADAELRFVEDSTAPIGNLLPALACLLLSLVEAESAGGEAELRGRNRAVPSKETTEQDGWKPGSPGPGSAAARN